MFKTILGILIFIVFLALLSLGSGLWTYVTAPFFGRVEAERQIESGASRRAFYDQFFDLCAGVQSIEGQIDAQKALLPDDQAKQNIAGLLGRRSQIIAKYNAQAAKDYTAARFHDADLPYHLPTGAYEGTRTACAAQ